jgi:hypothetical protein
MLYNTTFIVHGVIISLLEFPHLFKINARAFFYVYNHIIFGA